MESTRAKKAWKKPQTFLSAVLPFVAQARDSDCRSWRWSVCIRIFFINTYTCHFADGCNLSSFLLFFHGAFFHLSCCNSQAPLSPHLWPSGLSTCSMFGGKNHWASSSVNKGRTKAPLSVLSEDIVSNVHVQVSMAICFFPFLKKCEGRTQATGNFNSEWYAITIDCIFVWSELDSW